MIRLTGSLILAMALLTACNMPHRSSSNYQTTSYNSNNSQNYRTSVAPVTSVREGTIRHARNVMVNNAPTGVGIVSGAVIGGLLGSTIGGGTGQTLATVGGAVAGGYAGNQVEKSMRNKKMMTELTVKFRDGSVGTYTADARMGLRSGQRIKVITSGDDVQIIRY